MNPVYVAIKRMPGSEDVPLPAYMTERAAGMDLFAAVSAEIVLPPGRRCLVPLGFALALPEGYEAEIRPRSGLALKNGVTVLNSPGTIDSDYRGEVAVILINLGEEPFIIRRYDRIAQIIVKRTASVVWEIKDDLEATGRDGGGFGHTGNI